MALNLRLSLGGACVSRVEGSTRIGEWHTATRSVNQGNYIYHSCATARKIKEGSGDNEVNRVVCIYIYI
jgi:hypothetical protein